jgi:cold shock CspA family protein
MSTIRSIGYVKWFNKKQGFGFIHVMNGPYEGQDIFVHFSSIRLSKENPATGYKFLIQGEYVEFVVEKALKENHKYHATDITGIFEHNILCQTRQENMSQRLTPSHHSHNSRIVPEEVN